MPDFRPPAAARTRSGFVLVLTLWTLAGIAIAVALMTLWALDSVRNAGEERARTEAAAAAIGTRDTLLYLGATRAQTVAGQPILPMSEDERALLSLEEFGAMRRDPRGGELHLDGRLYLGLDGVVFALQDEAGLLPLLSPSEVEIDRYLEAHGVSAGDIPRLRDALLDYIDADSERRNNGAEDGDYRAAKLPPPPNRQLLMPAEARQALGWRELPGELLDMLPDQATTYYTGAVNLNTMPPALLPVWIPGCPRNCDALMARRDEEPFRNGSEVEALIGRSLPGDAMLGYRYLGSDVMRIDIRGASGAGMRVHVRFTPLAHQQAPWSILAAYPIPGLAEHEPARPTGSDLFADAPPG